MLSTSESEGNTNTNLFRKTSGKMPPHVSNLVNLGGRRVWSLGGEGGIREKENTEKGRKVNNNVVLKKGDRYLPPGSCNLTTSVGHGSPDNFGVTTSVGTNTLTTSPPLTTSWG